MKLEKRLVVQAPISGKSKSQLQIFLRPSDGLEEIAYTGVLLNEQFANISTYLIRKKLTVRKTDATDIFS